MIDHDRRAIGGADHVALTPIEQFDCDAALAACARGDRSALRAIYEREAGKMLGVAIRIVRKRHLADEILQDAFLQIWNKAGTFDPARGSARTWIFSIVRHRAISVVRRQSREMPTHDGDLDEAFAISVPALAAEAASLRRCLEALDPNKRTVILLAYVEGYSHSEIARRLGVPLGTAKAWVRRGLLALRDCLA